MPWFDADLPDPPRYFPDHKPSCACEHMGLAMDCARAFYTDAQVEHGATCSIQVYGLTRGTAETVAALWREHGLMAYAEQDGDDWYVSGETRSVVERLREAGL